MILKVKKYITQTLILSLKKKIWAILDGGKLIGVRMRHGEIEYIDGGVLYALYIAPFLKHCLTSNK